MTIRHFLFCLLIGLIAFSNLKCASTKNYKSFPAAKITMPGEIYSTYEMSEDEKARVRIAAQKAGMDPEYVFKRALETGWQEPLSDFNYRIENPDKIQALNVRIFADLDEERYMLIVPYQENKKNTMNITEDIFLIYRKVAVKKR